MKIELLEKQFAHFRDHPKAKLNKPQQAIFKNFSEQEPFTGWENYKRPAKTLKNGLLKKGDTEAVAWSLCHYDNNKIVPVDDKTGERKAATKAVRYWLYRWKTETEVDHYIEGQKAADLEPRKRNSVPKDKMKEIISKYKNDPIVKANGGAWGFSIKWDIDPMDPTKTYVRGESVDQQWEEEVEAKEVSGSAVLNKK